MAINQYVGSNIKKHRQAHHMTLEELANSIHKSKSTMSKYEKGLISLDVDTLYEIATVFSVSPSQLLSVPLPMGEAVPERTGFIKRQCMYSYDGRGKRILKSVIERYATSDPARTDIQMFYDVSSMENFGKCSSLYSGYSHTYMVLEMFQLTNQNHTIENAWMCAIGGLNQTNIRMGILSGLSSATMLPTARKVLISDEAMKDSELAPLLTLTKDDIRNLRKNNWFTIEQFME